MRQNLSAIDLCVFAPCDGGDAPIFVESGTAKDLYCPYCVPSVMHSPGVLL